MAVLLLLGVVLVDPVILSVQRPVGQHLWSNFSNFMMDLDSANKHFSLCKIASETTNK